MNASELSRQLFEVAQRRAALAGRRLGEGADQDLRSIIKVAAAHLASVADPAIRAQEIDQAERDLERLIDWAIEKALALPNYPNDLLGEKSYFPAKLRFCPCRPFC